MKNCIYLGEHADDATKLPPEWAIKEAQKDMAGGKGAFAGKKLLIIALNTEDDLYDVSYIEAGMTHSECVALMEVVKRIFIRDMGY